jgi:phosphoglycolate phosphatase
MAFDAASGKGLLFDLDGTLIDSSGDLILSGNWVRRREGLPDLEPARVAGYIGDGMEALVRRLLERPEGEVRESVEAFMGHYHEHCLDTTRLYPGVEATLRSLEGRGYGLAVVTNKPERLSRRILEGLGVAGLFGAILGGNSCAHKKPHPEPLWKACTALKAEAGSCRMIGDSRVDVEAARNAGMPSIAVLGGIGDQDLLRQSGPDQIVECFEQLLEIC